MPEIPCAEARESDFGDLDQGAQQAIEQAKALAHYTQMADEAAAMFKPATRMEWETHSSALYTRTGLALYLSAADGKVRIGYATEETTGSIRVTRAQAKSLAAELIKAAESLA